MSAKLAINRVAVETLQRDMPVDIGYLQIATTKIVYTPFPNFHEPQVFLIRLSAII